MAANVSAPTSVHLGLVRWGAVAAWLVVIFGLSAQPATQSSGLSGAIAQAIRNAGGELLADWAVFQTGALETLVRKAAHMFEYAVLGALLAWAWQAWPAGGAWPCKIQPSTVELPTVGDAVAQPGGDEQTPAGVGVPHEPAAQHRGVLPDDHKGILDGPLARFRWPFILAVAYAATDELHQRFVAGRAGQFTDVLLDTVGAALGVVLVALLARWRQLRHPARPNPKLRGCNKNR